MVLPAAVLVLFALVAPAARAQSKHLAPGFDALPADAKVIVAPLDVELFSISAGGVLEPRADWTAPRLGFFPRHRPQVELIARGARLKS